MKIATLRQELLYTHLVKCFRNAILFRSQVIKLARSILLSAQHTQICFKIVLFSF